MNAGNSKKKAKIAVIDDDREAWVRLCRILQAGGYPVTACLVCEGDSAEDIAREIRADGAHILLLDDKLGLKMRGVDVLEALGGEFLQTANPRVISISGEPRPEFLRYTGGSFPLKRYLIMPPGEGWERQARSLFQFVERSVKELGLYEP